MSTTLCNWAPTPVLSMVVRYALARQPSWIDVTDHARRMVGLIDHSVQLSRAVYLSCVGQVPESIAQIESAEARRLASLLSTISKIAHRRREGEAPALFQVYRLPMAHEAGDRPRSMRLSLTRKYSPTGGSALAIDIAE